MQRERILGGSLGLEEVDVYEKQSKGFDSKWKGDNQEINDEEFRNWKS